MNTKRQKAFKFFFENAGWSNPPGKAACSLEYARAEEEAEARGWTVKWRLDEDSHLDVFGVLECCERANKQCEYERHSHGRYKVCLYHYYDAHGDAMCATLYDEEGEILASLGMIEGATSEYRRVIEAELVLEALGELRVAEATEKRQESEWLRVAAL